MKKPPRIPLTRERVLAEALAIVDSEGLEALTMRRLGEALGVEAMSLYRHVPGRAALLDGIHETILLDLEDPPRARRWTESVRTQARAFRSLLLAHPNALVLFATRPAVTPGSLRHVDSGLAVLRGAGFSVDDAISAFQTLVTFVVGHALSTYGPIPTDERSTPSYDLTDLAALSEAAVALADHDVDAEFEFGLDAFVRGLEVKLGPPSA
jgi:AcrR family transcriptional regulator